MEDGIEETLIYSGFLSEHWTSIRSNSVSEWMNREIHRRTRAVGGIPEVNSALMLVYVWQYVIVGRGYERGIAIREIHRTVRR